MNEHPKVIYTSVRVPRLYYRGVPLIFDHELTGRTLPMLLAINRLGAALEASRG